MDPEEARLRQVFDEVIQAPPESRAKLLADLCGSNLELRGRVEALIAMAEGDESFLHLSAPIRAGAADVEGGSDAATPLAEGPGSRIGPYKLLQQIGEGGFGVVFMAEQEQPVRRRVALKIIKLGMDTRQVVARFEQERQALALMDHPNIAKVFDAGATESGRPYFVMEYVIGDPITDFADAHKLSVGRRLELFDQVCRAVQHAHTKGVIHRDLKPRNVLVSMSDGKPFAKVIDFGIAKATGARLTEKTLFTEHRQLIGTPEYMSPEQAEGSPDIDTRTDVYSLGVLLYELLTGATPFDARRLRSAAWGEMQRIIKEEDPPSPSQRLSRDLPMLAATASARRSEPAKLGAIVKGELDWIVMKALRKDRAERYESPSQLAADVQRHLAGEPIVAAPPSAAYRVRKFVRRHKGPVLAGSIVAAVLVLGVVTTSIGFALEAKQRRAAEAARLAEREQREAAEQATAAAEELRLAEAEARWDAEAQREAAEQNAYVANLFAAANDSYSARERLDACPEHLRGWEWNILDAITDTSAYVIEPDGSYRYLLGFAHDGSRFLTTGRGDGLEIRETATGRVVRTVADGFGVNEAEFSPDGRRLLLAGVDRIEGGYRAAVYDLETGSVIKTIPQEISPEIAFIDSGNHFITVEGFFSTSPVRVWDAFTGELRATIERDARGDDWGAASMNSRHVVTCSNKGVEAWDAPRGERLAVLSTEDQSFLGVTMSPDGGVVMAIDLEGHIQRWRAATGELLLAVRSPPGVTVDEGWWAEEAVVSFSADASRITVSGWGRDAVVVDASSGAELSRIRCQPHEVWFDAQISPDGTRLLTTGGPTPRLWDATTGRYLSSLPGHVRDVSDARFSPDGAWIVAAAYDGAVRTWRSDATPNPLVLRVPRNASDSRARDEFDPTILIEPQCLEARAAPEAPDITSWYGPAGATRIGTERDGCMSVAFSRDGARLLHTAHASVFEYDLEFRGGWKEHCHLDQYGGHVYMGAKLLGPDETGAYWSWRQSVQRWLPGATDPAWQITHPGIAAFDPIAQNEEGIPQLEHAEVSQDGGHLLAVFGKGSVWPNATPGRGVHRPGATLWICDGRTGRVLTERELAARWDHAAGLSPDGLRAAFVDERGGRLVGSVIDTATGEELLTLADDVGGADRCVFSPDGSRLVTVDRGQAMLWDADTGVRLATFESRRFSAENSLARFSLDGSRVVLVIGGTVILVDATTGAEIAELAGHANTITDAVFSPDGLRIVTASYDQTLRVWDGRTGRPLTLFSERMPTDGADGDGFPPAGFTCVAFSPDGCSLAAGTVDGRVLVFSSTRSRGQPLRSR